MLWDIFLSVLTTLFGIGATVVAWFGKEADNRFKGWKKIMPIGKWVIVFSICALIINSITVWRTSNQSTKFQNTLDTTKLNSDSIKDANKAIRSALELISIHSDSTGKLFISYLKDSVKPSTTKVSIYQAPDEPYITFALSNPITVDRWSNQAVHFKISIESIYNAAYNGDIKIGVAVITNGKFKPINTDSSLDELEYRTDFARQLVKDYGIPIPGLFPKYYFYLSCKYNDINGKSLTTSQVYEYRWNDGNASEISSPYKEQIINIFKK